MSIEMLISNELIVRELDCEAADVVYVKSVVTAYDGLCCLFSDAGGRLTLVAPRGREAELDHLVNDLVDEFAASKECELQRRNLIRDPLRRC